jgi:hypothetical protein
MKHGYLQNYKNMLSKTACLLNLKIKNPTDSFNGIFIVL